MRVYGEPAEDIRSLEQSRSQRSGPILLRPACLHLVGVSARLAAAHSFSVCSVAVSLPPSLSPLVMSSAAAAAGAGAAASGVLSAPLFRALTSSISQNQMIEFSRYAQLATHSLDGTPNVRTINVRGAPFEDTHDGQTRGALKFSSDARSSKIAELIASARTSKDGKVQASLCWFFPITREQFRLRCDVQLIFSEGVKPDLVDPAAFGSGADSASVPSSFPSSLMRTDSVSLSSHAQFWKGAHSSDARGLFELAPPGSVKKRSQIPMGDLDRFEPQPIDENVPSRNFVTCLLLPTRCDYLKLPRPSDDTRGQMTRVQHHESLTQPARAQTRWLHTREESSGQWTATELNP